jgi:hypothetical protein
MTRLLRRRVVPGLFGLASALLVSVAEAHFTLEAPASWANQDSLGGPQKSAPCGQSDPGMSAVATGAVTAFRPGETITVTIKETVFHPGHYRVALAVADRSELPADPAVTPGTTACGSTTIETSPKFPLLADGLLKHTAPFSSAQSFEVTLPSNVTCTKCTLQIVEFMSDHGLNNPGGCFYHHCADISIQSSTASTGGAAGAAGQAGATGRGGSDGGGRDSGGQANGGAAGNAAGAVAGQGGFVANGGSAATTGGLGSGGQLGVAGTASAGTPSDAGCSCRAAGAAPRRVTEMFLVFAAFALRRARRR